MIALVHPENHAWFSFLQTFLSPIMFSSALFLSVFLFVLLETGSHCVNGFAVNFSGCSEVSASETMEYRCCPHGTFGVESGEIVSFVKGRLRLCGETARATTPLVLDKRVAQNTKLVVFSVVCLLLVIAVAIFCFIVLLVILAGAKKTEVGIPLTTVTAYDVSEPIYESAESYLSPVMLRRLPVSGSPVISL